MSDRTDVNEILEEIIIESIISTPLVDILKELEEDGENGDSIIESMRKIIDKSYDIAKQKLK